MRGWYSAFVRRFWTYRRALNVKARHWVRTHDTSTPRNMVLTTKVPMVLGPVQTRTVPSNGPTTAPRHARAHRRGWAEGPGRLGGGRVEEHVVDSLPRKRAVCGAMSVGRRMDIRSGIGCDSMVQGASRTHRTLGRWIRSSPEWFARKKCSVPVTPHDHGSCERQHVIQHDVEE